jgi:hypothetical protein
MEMLIEKLKQDVPAAIKTLSDGKRWLGLSELPGELKSLGGDYRAHAQAIRNSHDDPVALRAELSKLLAKLEQDKA